AIRRCREHGRLLCGGRRHTGAKGLWRQKQGACSTQEGRQRSLIFQTLSAIGAAFQVRAKVFKLLASQCIVKIKQNVAGTLIAAAHSAAPLARRSGVRKLPERSDRSLDRALPSRDITVPVGHPKILAISWYDSSPYSRSTMISRNSLESCWIAS